MKEFQINKYILMKMEKEKTNIYVCGVLFQQCKQVVLNLTLREINNIGQFKTIDDFLGNHIYLEENNNTLKPETAFWAHCSNLQTWAENSYDTGILDSRLAFPLLKRLTEVGDKTAEKVFKQEIIKGMMSENFNRILLLVENSYLDYLTTKDLKFITSKYKLFDFILNEIREKKENIITFVGKLPTFDKYYSLLFYRPIKKKIRAMKKSKEFNDLYIMIVYDFIGKLEKKLIDKIIYNEGLLDLFNEMFANLRSNKKKELLSNLDDKSYLKWLLRQNLSHQN